MQFTPTGDSAVRVELAATCSEAVLDEVARLARALSAARLAGVTDVVAAFTTITVHYDPALRTWAEMHEALTAAAKKLKSAKRAAARDHVIPVCYGGEHGPDLADVAQRAGLGEAAVIAAHTGARYRVAAVGFSPGFPYLFGLPKKIHTPRRATPRTRVPAGSVGIGGEQTGVYPHETPGGWNLIGRTALALFDPANENAPALLAPGDTVRFTALTPAKWSEPATSAAHRPAVPGGNGALEIVRPGALTTVQDLGRPGRQAFGIPPGGAMDPLAARVANLLLGNAEDAPVLEGATTGPVLKFHETTWIAVTGADVECVPGWRPLRIEAGAELSLAKLTAGVRVYVAVAGGLVVPRVQGGAGPLPGEGGLRAGERLRCGVAGFAETDARWSAGAEFRVAPPAGRAAEIGVRFVRDAQRALFTEESVRAFAENAFEVTAQSSRMGLRLKGAPLARVGARELLSEGVVAGTVQVPPDGQPIVLMADRQTIGGYPKIGHVITADLPKLAQARTGDIVRFTEVSIEDAQAERRAQERSLALLRAGVKMRLR